MKELVYLSSPARLSFKKREMMEFVAAHNKAPFHPFNAFPLEYFENGYIGREKTLEYCCAVTDICSEMWVFGISEGVLMEVDHFLRQNELTNKDRPLVTHVKDFDDEWKEYHGLYLPKFPVVLAKLAA